MGWICRVETSGFFIFFLLRVVCVCLCVYDLCMCGCECMCVLISLHQTQSVLIWLVSIDSVLWESHVSFYKAGTRDRLPPLPDIYMASGDPTSVVMLGTVSTLTTELSCQPETSGFNECFPKFYSMCHLHSCISFTGKIFLSVCSHCFYFPLPVFFCHCPLKANSACVFISVLY